MRGQASTVDVRRRTPASSPRAGRVPEMLARGARLFGRIDPAEHLFEVHLHRVVAEAGAQLEAVVISDEDRAAPRVEYAFRLERLQHAARIAAADPEQGGE